MCELILSDIWQFSCHFLDENDKEINSKTGCKEIEPVVKTKTGFTVFD